MSGPILLPQSQLWNKYKDLAVVLTVSAAQAVAPNHMSTNARVTMDPVLNCALSEQNVYLAVKWMVGGYSACIHDVEYSAPQLSLVLTASRRPSL